jgi:hypothetical protein
LDNSVEIGAFQTADIEAGRGCFGYDVGGLSTVGDDAVNPYVLLNMLAKILDTVKHHHDTVQGASAEEGGGGGVAALPSKLKSIS